MPPDHKPREIYAESLERPPSNTLALFHRFRDIAEGKTLFDRDMLIDCLSTFAPDPRSNPHDHDVWLGQAVHPDPIEEKQFLRYVHYDKAAKRLEASDGHRVHLVQRIRRHAEWYSPHGLPLDLADDMLWPDMSRILPPPRTLAKRVEIDIPRRTHGKGKHALVRTPDDRTYPLKQVLQAVSYEPTALYRSNTLRIKALNGRTWGPSEFSHPAYPKRRALILPSVTKQSAPQPAPAADPPDKEPRP